MKPGRFSFAALLPLFCLPAVADRQSGSRIAVYVEFQHAPSSVLVDKMKQEVSYLMKPAGLEFEWRELRRRSPEESFPDLVVIRFRGNCSAQEFQEPVGVPSTTLASTALEAGHVLPFSQVECDELGRYISPLTQGRSDRDAALGRALGRVVAHEMYHMLVGTRNHGERGAARARYNRQELLAAKFGFDTRETKQLREYARRTALFN